MRLSLLPAELLGLLLSASLDIRYAFASPSVNVALQASFNAPPYILELLLVPSLFNDPVDICTDTRPGRQLQKKIRPPTSPSLIELLKGVSRIVRPIRNSIIPFSRC